MMSKTVFINQTETLTDAATIQQLAVQLNLPAQGVALAINQQVVPRAQWESTPVTDGAQITLIKAVFGG